MSDETVAALVAGLDLYDLAPDALDAATEAALDARQALLLLYAPPVVDLTSREELPLLAIEAARTDRSFGVKGRGVVVATRLEGNVTDAAAWAESKAPGERRPAAPPDPNSLVGFAASAVECDLRDRLPGLAWRPCTLLVRLIVGDHVTPPARVALTAGTLAEDPDVRTFVEWAQSQQPAADGDVAPLPTDVERDEWTPDAPDQPGLALALQRVSLARRGDQLLFRGAYRLPLRPAEIVPAGSPGGFDAQGRPVVARLTITLVFVGHDFHEPQVIRLRVDANALAPDLPDGRACAVGQFRCDLFGHPDVPRALQRYSVYAFAGEYMTGPLALTLISETLVPLRDDGL